jgi:hypothetical protein
MSRAKPEAERNALDFYATPQPLADAICDLIDSRFRPWHVIEPSAGHGPFVRSARRVWGAFASITAIDVDPVKLDTLGAAGADVSITDDWASFTRTPRPANQGTTLIVGNPPFRDAEAHIRAALDWMAPGDELAFLLRLNLLGSRARLDLWESTPLAEVVPLVPRPSFTGGGSDATEYALFRWVKGHQGPARLSLPLVWNKPRRVPSRAASGGGEAA